MQIKSLTAVVVACALAVVGCDEERPGESARVVVDGAVELPNEVDAGERGELGAGRADAGTGRPFLADAAAELADASPAPGVAVDGGSVVLPIVEPPAPVVEPARCETKFYRDADGDSFGDPATALASCAQPDGYVANGADCYDGNMLARPGQEGRFTAHRGDGSFDYDCDGAAVPLTNSVAVCPTFSDEDRLCFPTAKKAGQSRIPAQDCYETMTASWQAMREGWWQSVPACGETALYGVFIDWTIEASYTCGEPKTRRVQACN